jgi:hypothetical protein
MHPTVQAATIASKATKIVAVITALGGIIGGYFIKSAVPTNQRWLTIHSVAGPEGANLKLVARVNTIPYSYPADVVTTLIGQNMPEQKCPLPIADNYTISFEAYFRQGESGSFRNAKNREAPSFLEAQLPIERQKYSLHEVIDGEKRNYDAMTVTYSIR